MFGSRLTLRLVLLFALMAVLPGALIYGVSVQFLARSIESWFDVRVDKALEGGLNLGRSALDNMLKDSRRKADAMALALSTRPPAEHVAALNALREQAGVPEATLFTQRGKRDRVLGQRARRPHARAAGRRQSLRQSALQQGYRGGRTMPDKGLYLRVVVPVQRRQPADEARVLQVLQPVPAAARAGRRDRAVGLPRVPGAHCSRAAG